MSDVIELEALDVDASDVCDAMQCHLKLHRCWRAVELRIKKSTAGSAVVRVADHSDLLVFLPVKVNSHKFRSVAERYRYRNEFSRDAHLYAGV